MRSGTSWATLLGVTRSCRRVLAWTLAASLALASAPPGFAQSDKAAAAKKAMEEGQGLYAQKKFAEAAQAFQRAYATEPYGAFLFNEAVCYEKLDDEERAILTFERYLTTEPSASDAGDVRERIRRLEAKRDAKKAGQKVEDTPKKDKDDVIKSLILVESEPPGAPATVWERVSPSALPFVAGRDNEGWRRVKAGPTPVAATVLAGRYHVVVDKWQTYNASETDIEVSSGGLYFFKANLSQGAFMGFLRVQASVPGATIYLDDAEAPWGTVPHGELVKQGKHKLRLEAPGYDDHEETIDIEVGKDREIRVELQRVSYGYLLIDGNVPSLRVSIDGQERGVATAGAPLKIKEKAGRHRIKIEAEDKKTYEGDVEVPLGQSREVHAVLVSRPSRGNAWVSASLGAVSLGAGIYLGLKSNQIHDDLKADRAAGRLAQGDERVGTGKVYAYGSNAGFALAGLFGILATTQFLRDPTPPSGVSVDDPVDFAGKARPKKKPEATSLRIHLAPGVGASAQGLTLFGTF